MYSKQVSSIEDFGKSFKKGSFGLYAATITPMKVNVFPRDKQRKDVTPSEKNRYKDRVFTLSIYQNAASGIDYYSCVKSECKREGILFTDEAFFEAFPKEKTYAEGVEGLDNFLLQKTDSTQRYLRLYVGRKPTHVKYFTIIDNRLATEEERKDILRYVTPRKESAKQEAIGIRNIVAVRNIKVENVAFLAQGENYYLNEAFGKMDFSKLKDLFAEKK